ncbi:MAG: methyltransferase domain-containing protein [Hyphomicrobium sp.]
MSSQWARYIAAFDALMECGQDPELKNVAARWADLVAVVERTDEAPPYHIALMARHVEKLRGGRDAKQIAVLEHGCGAGHTLAYLAAMGYSDISGIDVGGDFSARNRVLHHLFGGERERLRIYDGRHIPHPDARFDFVFSEQVIEHVSDAVFETYYTEEARVLKPGGLAAHHVPHRLVPYDSHTLTWFIHYLPKPLYHRLGNWLGAPVPDHLHLRWPWVHRRKMREVMGDCRDTTLDRFQLVDDLPYYDGPIGLRRKLAAILTTPVVGPLAGQVLRHFIMLETVSTKTGPVGRDTRANAA